LGNLESSGAGRPALPTTSDDAAGAGDFWTLARAELDGLPGGRGLNIAHEAVDRHAQGSDGASIALRWLGASGERRDITYGELSALSSRFANLLDTLGLRKGERVFALTGRIPALYVAALGTWKAGAVFCPLFAAFGPKPIEDRLALGSGRVLLTTLALYERKIRPLRARLPDLKHVLLADGPAPDEAGVHELAALMEAASPEFAIPFTDPEDTALLHFTSGTTGRPKGAVHVHDAVVAHAATARLALDLRQGDVYWCTADPGWVTGTSYGVIAPLVIGATAVIDEAEFDAERWYRVLQEEKVTVWYTAPTAIRMLRNAGGQPSGKNDFPNLRVVASVGEPLNGELVHWGATAFGQPIHDTWWQTETGAIMIANYPGMDLRPGAMGRPLPGVEAALVTRRAGAGVALVEKTGTAGELALRAGWPSMFRAYLNDDERYRDCFADGWYLTGDLARCDADGYFWFVGRRDDVIKSAGHLIGPFEVESALMEHPAVAESGVIGKPDPVAMETVKAFVTLRAGWEANDGLLRELMAHARRRLGPAAAPREIAFIDSLPKTRSGKIMRRLLKARELGLPEGDLSMLEDGASTSAAHEKKEDHGSTRTQ
jgi:acetyl-CoA synthetase